MNTSTRLVRLLAQVKALQSRYPGDEDYQFYLRFALAALEAAMYCAKIQESREEPL